MPSLQKIKAKRAQSSGRGAAASYRWQKQIVLSDGRRTTIRLGQLSVKAANEISDHIDYLIEAAKHSTRIHPDTEAWLQSADPKLVDKLSKLGLCKPSTNVSVSEFVSKYIQQNSCGWEENTIRNFRQVERLVQERFPVQRITELTKTDAADFYTWMRTTKGLGENSVKKHYQRTRQIFEHATDMELVGKNVFRVRAITTTVGVAEKQYIPPETIDAVIEYLPADKLEWKLLFAISRYLGLRIPSEIQQMTWADVDWSHNTITIHSPKTKRHPGGARRKAPIVPEIADLLSRQFAVPGEEQHVFPTLRRHTNLGTTAKKYVTKAGHEPWAEFWNALRASCETDMMDRYGLRRACKFIGNSPSVAMRHYSLLRNTDFLDDPKSDAKNDAVGARIAENDAEAMHENPQKQRVLCESAPPGGIEPPAKL